MKTWLQRTWALIPALVLMLASSAVWAGAEKPFDEKMAQLAVPYMTISDTLAKDSMVGVDDALRKILEEVGTLKASNAPSEQQEAYAELPKLITEGAQAVLDAPSLAEKREAFKGLSKPFARWATISKNDGVQLVYCPMAKGSWLQEKGPVENPYHGSEMLRCGQIIERK